MTKLRLWWWDVMCGIFDHRWQKRGENWAAKECSRCHRKRLMTFNTVTGETNWIITP